MNLVAKIFIGVVAFEHLFIMWMEMFAWTTKGKSTFKLFSDDLFEKTKVMAANQGLYNGFLAAGLIWSLFVTNVIWSKNIAIFFVCCVVIAGIYGALTVSKEIFFKQAIPAIITMVLIFI